MVKINLKQINLRTVARNLRQHVTDSTSMLVESTPVFAAFEVGVAGMTNTVSLNTRVAAAGLAYLILGYVYGKGRDLWRGHFGITQESEEKIQKKNDRLYTAAFNAILSPIIYGLTGAEGLQILTGTGICVGLGLVNGWPMGYVMDAYRDLTGFEECKRTSYPKIIKRQSPAVKLGLAAMLAAGSLALTDGIYKLNGYLRPEKDFQHIEQKVNIAENPR